MSGIGDAPSSGPWDFHNQATHVSTFEDAAGGIGVPSAVGKGCGLCEEMFADVSITEDYIS